MTDATFQGFLVGGLLVLIGAIVFLAWTAWRWVDRERDMETMSLKGVGHELNYNLQRVLDELTALTSGQGGSLLPVSYPQLTALLTRPAEADRRALTAIHGLYETLADRKLAIRSAMAQGKELNESVYAAADTMVDGYGLLYLWEKQKGRPPKEAYSTRSWHVRDWMKALEVNAKAIPGLHLRDQVVERLRERGMVLTPRPLTHTAHEYYSMQYDRKADPNAPFWKRKLISPEEDGAGVSDHMAA